jgi:glycosyltransferase involved in cell wall biosynthesis
VTEIADSVAALRQRLVAVAPYLAPAEDLVQLGVGPLLSTLASAVRSQPSDATAWLLGTAVAGGFPTGAEVQAIRRGLELATDATAFGAVLSGVARTASEVREDVVEAVVVESSTVVDVEFCAKNIHNTGIQRVVRSTMPSWEEQHEPVFVAWSDDLTGYRAVTAEQRRLVLEWSSAPRVLPAAAPSTSHLVIPWNSTIVIPEVPAATLLERQTSIARFSGNSVGLIGYDAIPVVSADYVVDEESDRFAHYLGLVKYSAVVSSISETTAHEFEGFTHSLSQQGIKGPRVTVAPLPVAMPPKTVAEASADRAVPLVLMVGSIEPRKNQQAVLSASRLLWAEGLDFELLIIGGGTAWIIAELDKDIRALKRAGRSVSLGRGVSDAALASAYRDATVVVFPSLQEGYGLPVAEALATGTPVITTRYGSTAEIARAGGCMLIDPRDDGDIASALRSILTDDALHSRLVAEALARPVESWSGYAEQLWTDFHEVQA